MLRVLVYEPALEGRLVPPLAPAPAPRSPTAGEGAAGRASDGARGGAPAGEERGAGDGAEAAAAAPAGAAGGSESGASDETSWEEQRQQLEEENGAAGAAPALRRRRRRLGRDADGAGDDPADAKALAQPPAPPGHEHKRRRPGALRRAAALQATFLFSGLWLVAVAVAGGGGMKSCVLGMLGRASPPHQLCPIPLLTFSGTCSSGRTTASPAPAGAGSPSSLCRRRSSRSRRRCGARGCGG